MEEQDLGALLGIAERGIKSRWLMGEESGKEPLDSPLRLRHTVIEPGKAFPAQRNESRQIIFIISGKATFRSESKDYRLEEGDLAYLGAEELYSIVNTADIPLKLLYTTLDQIETKYPRHY